MANRHKDQQTANIRGGSDEMKTSTISVGTSWGTRVRNALFPIHGDEVKKFLLIGSIKFFIILALVSVFTI